MGKTHYPAKPGRRSFLGFTAAGFAMPLGAMAPASWRTGRSSPLDTLDHPPICHAAADVKCHRARPRAARNQDLLQPQRGLHRGHRSRRAARFLRQTQYQIERINFSTAADQLLELLASGKADVGVGMALGLAKAARTGLRREADRGDAWRVYPPTHQPGVRHHQRRWAEGQGHWNLQHGKPG